jgi:hypothetical protein
MEFGNNSSEDESHSDFAWRLKYTQARRRSSHMMILDADAGQNPDEILIDEELLSLSMTEGVGDEGVEILRAIIRD